MLSKYLRLGRIVFLFGFLFIACGASQPKPRVSMFDDMNTQLYIERHVLSGEVISIEIVYFDAHDIRISEKYNHPIYTKDFFQLVVDNWVKSSKIPIECLNDEDKAALDMKNPNWKSYRSYFAMGYLKRSVNVVVGLFK